ncbi:NLI interacting factor-like phosphatase [Nitzschia inconspicua]|uniref:protein-serine/threonine phosphatase n=1 Tax=Nitzschia inconspicua TaxID=303405 RepID=A0A9K3P9W7_9STRA|nr:NLI interacting factor-like phosphatase [Nitzschia inconspicua]KAG7362622.1 NLI interacting factor-like phosphatase [Nitzschia inconspicua]
MQVTMKAVPSSISVVTKPSPLSPQTTTSSIKPKDLIPITAPATGFLRMIQQQPNTPNRRRVIGYIEECLHPTILEGMCVVCGERPTTTTTTIPNKYNSNTDSLKQQSRSIGHKANVNTGPNLTQVTVSGGITMTVSQQEGQCMAQWDANRLYRQQRLSLVLDLDHTLNNNTNNKTSAAGVRTIRLPLHEGTTDPLQLQQPSNHLHHQQQQWAQHYVKLRPHVNDLLRWIESTYEVSVYTAGTKHYAEEATMVLCRNLVGSNRDWDDIERLRYQVQVQLQMAYHHYQQQQQQIMINDTSRNNKTNTMDNTDDIGNNNVAAKNKRTNDQIQQQQLQQKEDDKEKEEEIMDMNDDDDDDNDDTKHKPVKKKPKKISFAPVSTVEQEHTNHHQDEENNNPITTTRTTTTSSYHHTKSDHNNMITKDDDEEEELERLQQELVQADELEQAARRLRQKLFGSRVYSRTDLGDLGQHVKSHKRIFPWLCGLVPLHKQQSITAAAASPNTTVRPPIVRYAQSLGAKTQDKVDETVTHNVAAKDGSEKANIARTIPGCLVVRPGWLMESYWSIRKANVQPYLMAQGPAAIPIKKDENDDDDDDDDDGFALELEDELLNG